MLKVVQRRYRIVRSGNNHTHVPGIKVGTTAGMAELRERASKTKLGAHSSSELRRSLGAVTDGPGQVNGRAVGPVQVNGGRVKTVWCGTGQGQACMCGKGQ